MYHSLTSTYMPNFVKLKTKFLWTDGHTDGQMDGQMGIETGFISYSE